VGNLISVPFQENMNLNAGPQDRTQNVLNIQPVIPIAMNSDWNIMTRTILPIVLQPGFAPNQDRTNGIGDLQFTAFLSPAKPGVWIWGLAPSPSCRRTATSCSATTMAGLGPSFVVLRLERGNPWVYGVLVNNIWSVSSSSSPSYSNGLMQPFVNYNFKGGAYLTSSPVMTVNWKAKGSQQWTVPMGGGMGKIFHFGRLPVNTQVSAYYNVVRPDFGANWQVRAQMQFMFPK
jgi:hypothetical protein